MMQLTGTVTPELRNARFLTVRQVHFNLNGKLGCKVLSSLKVFIYIYARLVAHRSYAEFSQRLHCKKRCVLNP
jgi:hypothetical protein